MLQKLLDWLFPRQCYVCKAYTDSVACKACLEALTPSPVIKQVDQLMVQAFFEYQGSCQKLLHALKFHKIKTIAPLLGNKLSCFTPEYFQDIAYWVAVPSHPKRYKSRGFNPVIALFDEVIPHWKGQWKEGLKRHRETPFLYDLSATDRLIALENAFSWEGDSLQGKTVMLVDDIFTTGATLSTIAKLLKAQGAQVYALTFAYVTLKSK